MKYYLDTEFYEYFKQPKLFGVSVGKPIPTIDFISIGIVSEEKKFIGGVDPINVASKPTISKHNISREYYAVNKEFNIKDAWDSWQWSRKKVNDGIPGAYKEYWLRENVLKSIYEELLQLDGLSVKESNTAVFSLEMFKFYIEKYGKTREQIAQEVMEFCGRKVTIDKNAPNQVWAGGQLKARSEPVFYGYYADYDWVVFCWLFGRMISLPKGFPWYCIDLKQMLDNKYMNQENKYKGLSRLDAWLKDVKKMSNYPKQENEHNALDDARWNKKLHEFIESLPSS